MTRAHFEDKVGIWQLRNEITIQVAHARHFFFSKKRGCNGE